MPPLRLVGERGQLGGVEPVGAQQVAAIPVLDPLLAEHRTQAAHQHRELLAWPGRRIMLPQGVDEHVGRHHLPGAEGQVLQRQPRLPTAECLRLDPVHAEFAEHADG